MPKASEFPRLRSSKKTGKGGATWTSWWYDMRGLGRPDVPLGTDRAAALEMWAHIAGSTEVGSAYIGRAVSDTALKREKASVWSGYPAWAKALYAGAGTRSRLAGRDHFSVADFLEVVDRAGGRCELSGIEFETSKSPGRRNPFSASLDRIDYSTGYTRGNVRLICLILNCALADFGEAALERAATAFLKARRGSG